LLLPLVIAGCSGGGARKTATGTLSSPCPLIATLDRTATEVARADVSDPAAFGKTLDDAAARYVSTVADLRKVTPASLGPDLERLVAAVQQYRFEDAAAARASLGAWAAPTCGTATTTTTTTAAK
jgi:hypothetical protein